MTSLIIFFILLCLGYGFGRIAERRHYRSILEREKSLADITVFATKRPPADIAAGSFLVQGSVVVTTDYFKQFLSALRSLVGGRLTAYETLIDRARREALLRMKAQAREQGAGMVFNVKLETANISKGQGAAIEVLAYGTALKQQDSI